MNAKKIFFYHFLMNFIPATKLFKLKSYLLRWCGAIVGENVRIVSSAKFYTSGSLQIGDNTWLGHEVLISGGSANISIGMNCDIAPRVSIISGTHKINRIGEKKIAGEGYSKSIVIGDGCWLCANSLVLGGAKIGKNCILKPNCSVSASIEAENIIQNNKDFKKIY